MFDIALQTVQTHHMFTPGDTVVIGLSGGADSVALLHFLRRISPMSGLTLLAVHVHHGLRGAEADGDQRFVEELCAAWEVALQVCRVDAAGEARARGLTTEEAGRFLRYRCFDNAAAVVKGPCRIAVAHNQNDNAETVLLHLLRGAGLQGLCGIPYCRGAVVRPLLDVPRADIERYLREHKLTCRNDSTNEKNDYTRNKVRNLLLPLAQETVNPGAVAALARTARQLSEENAYLETQAAAAYTRALLPGAEGANPVPGQDCLRLDRAVLEQLPEVILRRVLRLAVRQFNPCLVDIDAGHTRQLQALTRKDTGKTLCLPNGLRASTSYDALVFYRTGTTAPQGFCFQLTPPCLVTLPSFQLSASFTAPEDLTKIACTKIFNYDKIYDKIQEGLCVRTRAPGDTIYLKPINGRKKIQDYFVDRKVNRAKRDAVPMLACGRRVLWIMDEANITDETALADEYTQNKLYIHILDSFRNSKFSVRP